MPPGPELAAADTLALTGPASLDSIAASAPVESAGVVTVPRSARTPRTLPRQGRYDQPRWVMLRSLVVPGWGQVHNRAWLKAILVAAGDGAMRVKVIQDERRLRRLNGDANARLGDLTAAAGDTTAAGIAYRTLLNDPMADPDALAAAQAAYAAANVRLNSVAGSYNNVVNAYNALLGSSLNRRWLLGGVVLYALVDAYVDAHFRNFDVDFQIDPALPGGTPTPGSTPKPGMRLQLRWSF
ncbi:MAG TPA: DUF5683 domain-containing protein [Candidatus Eisenbacteria bacterium]|nr:DUF5683 domain-containing protein [Candidatus Eisenbacteria bacterium]